MSTKKLLAWAGLTALAGAAAAVCYKAIKNERDRQKDVVCECYSADFSTGECNCDQQTDELTEEDRAAAEAAFEAVEARDAELGIVQPEAAPQGFEAATTENQELK